MSEPAFLTLAEVIEIHADQILNYGGGDGLRDIELLSSAVAMPYVSFSKQFLHIDTLYVPSPNIQRKREPYDFYF